MSKSTLNKFPVLRLFITFYKVFYDICGKTSRFHYFYCLFSGKGASGRNSAVGIPLTSRLAKKLSAREIIVSQIFQPAGDFAAQAAQPPILQRDLTGVDPSCAI